MKLSCTPISFQKRFVAGDMDLPQFIETCASLGCQGIDLLASCHYPWLWKNPTQEKQRLSGWLRDAGLTLAAYAAGNNFALADAQARQQQIQDVQTSIREAAELGAPLLRIFGGRIEPERLERGMGVHIGMPFVMQALEQCLPVAQQHGVVLALENHGNLPGRAYEIQQIIRHFDSPFLQCTFDIANFLGGYLKDEVDDPVRAADKLMPWIAHVHVKDVGPTPPGSSYRLEPYVTGQGIVPIRQVLASIAESGYQGFYSLEYEAIARMPELQGVAESLAYLKQVASLHQTLGLVPASCTV